MCFAEKSIIDNRMLKSRFAYFVNDAVNLAEYEKKKVKSFQSPYARGNRFPDFNS